MKDTLKSLIKIAAAVAIFFLGAPWLTVLVGGFLALKSVDLAGNVADSIRKRRVSAKSGVDKETLDKNFAIHKENTNKKFFDEKNNQWNLHDLPLDMYPTVGLKSKNALFTCAGVSNVVTGTFLGSRFGKQKVEFSMVIDDSAKAEGMANYITENGLIGTKVNRDQFGRFVITSDNAVDMTTLVKEFYPPRTMTVSREIKTTRQYRIPGCKSYEDALEKFKENKFTYSSVNTFISYQDTVDGVVDHPFVSGSQLDTSSLQIGEYIINETSWEVYSRNVTINGGVDCTDEALRSMASDMFGKPGEPGQISFSKENDLVEDKCSAEPVLSNGLEGKTPDRYIMYEGKAVRMPQTNDDGYDMNANMILRFNSIDEMRSVVNGDSPIKGHMVLVDTVAPAADKGEFILTVPADRRLIESLGLRNGDPAAVAEKYDGSGLTASQVQAACVIGELQKNGYVTAELKDTPDFSNASLNGVPLSEFNARIEDMVEDEKVEQLKSREQAEQWLRDAAKIQSVHIDLDIKHQELVITSTVGTPENNVTKVETRHLDDDELKEMSSRELPSNAEMKDLLMMSHPKYFDTYHVPGTDGEGYYHDPVYSFIHGEKPRLASEVKMAEEMKRKAEKEEQRQQQKSQQSHAKLVKHQNMI